MSGNVGSGIGRSGVVQNMEVVVVMLMVAHSIPEKHASLIFPLFPKTNPLVSGHATVDPSVT